MPAPLLEVCNVSVRYRTTEALRDVSVQLQPGVTGLLGHNGAGKSTLIEVLSGMRPASAGRVLFRGEAVDSSRGAQMTLRQNLGMLPQRLSFFPAFTAREFVEYAAWLHRMPRSQVGSAVNRVLELVRLTEHSQTQMRQLSGGMAQRVGIAAALVHGPTVLLLDEPSNGLDIEQREIFRGIVRDLDREAVTIISSHLAEDVAAVCDRVVVLQDGTLVADDTLTALVGAHVGATVSGPELEKAYLRILGVAR